ncbi:hypothetical protein BH09MYX1_BH09MYX1_41550 [soil metagenome]
MARAPYRGTEGAAPPPASPPLPAFVDGELLVLAREASFPKVCVKCGSRRELLFREHRFAFAQKPTMGKRVLWSVMFGALGGAIAQARATEYARFTLPICPRCNTRWTDASIAAGVALLPMIGVAIWLFVLWARSAPGTDVVIPGVAFFATIVVAALVNRSFVPPRIVRCLGIEGRYVKLSGVSERAKAALLGKKRKMA